MQSESLPTLTPQPQVEVSPKKQFNLEKVFGLILLFAGIIMISISILLIFRVLTGVQKPPQVLNIEAPTLPTSHQFPEGVTIELPETKIIPDELYNGVVNIGLFYLLMMFIASSGAKFADIGIKLMKKIRD